MALPQVPLFSPLDNKQLTHIAQAMYEQTFDVGEDIILQVSACSAATDGSPVIVSPLPLHKGLHMTNACKAIGRNHNAVLATMMMMMMMMMVMVMMTVMMTVMMMMMMMVMTTMMTMGWCYQQGRRVAAFVSAKLLLNCGIGGAVLLQGSDGDQFYVIQQGEVKIIDAGGKELSRKGPKDYFGELSLLKNEPRAATVRAVTRTSVLSLNR